MKSLAMLALAGLAWNPLISGAESAVPVAVLDLEQMPASWRPPASSAVRARLSQAPWSREETLAVERAVNGGFEEMRSFLHGHQRRIRNLSDNAIESVLDLAYAAGDRPELQKRARAEAAEMIEVCARPWLKRRPAKIRAGDLDPVMQLCIYAQNTMPSSNVIPALVERANHVLEPAGSAVKVLWNHTGQPVTVDIGYEANMLCVLLIGARTVPGLKLGDADRRFVEEWWPKLARYPFPVARSFARRANDPRFYNAAYLGTHVGYIPTGYGRHAIYVNDCPEVYRFLRENFYDVLEMGELDLVSEFVDMLRQFGCTEENDLQVRDGTRYLMSLYHAAGDCWMAHREVNEYRRSGAYDRLHKPWTAVAGIRRRVLEPPAEGTYGAVFRSWFPAPGR